MNRETKARLTAKLLIDSPWTAVAFFQLLDACQLRKSQEIDLLVQQLIARFPTPISVSRFTEYLLQQDRNELAKLSPRRLRQKSSDAELRATTMRSGINSVIVWGLPSIDSVPQLARLLKVSPRQLDWLTADFL